MNSIDNLQHNIDQIISLLEQVPDQKRADGPTGTQLVCFPENCLYLRLKEGEKIPPVDLHASYWQKFREIARVKQAVLHFGSVPVRGGDKLRNSSVVVRPEQDATVTYAKIHLFDIDVDGHKPMRESDAFEYGATAEILAVDDWRIGQSICYDLRFAELYSYYAKENVDVILIPSSFLVPTGQAHWEVLVRARAIESQAYVLAAAQAGSHKGAGEGVRQTYGHAMIVDPWGKVLADGGASGVQLLSATVQRQQIESVRRQIPMAHHRRFTQA